MAAPSPAPDPKPTPTVGNSLLANIANFLFCNKSFLIPTAYYIGLNYQDEATQALGGEPDSSDGYYRVKLNNSVDVFGAVPEWKESSDPDKPADNSIRRTNTDTITLALAGKDWKKPALITFWDKSNGGNCLFKWAVKITNDLTLHSIIKIPEKSLTLELTADSAKFFWEFKRDLLCWIFGGKVLGYSLPMRIALGSGDQKKENVIEMDLTPKMPLSFGDFDPITDTSKAVEISNNKALPFLVRKSGKYKYICFFSSDDKPLFYLTLSETLDLTNGQEFKFPKGFLKVVFTSNAQPPTAATGTAEPVATTPPGAGAGSTGGAVGGTSGSTGTSSPSPSPSPGGTTSASPTTATSPDGTVSASPTP